jgi:hypothetical protein
MAGRTALSIATNGHKDRRSKGVSGQEIPPHRPVPDSPFWSFLGDLLRFRTKYGLNSELITNAIKIVLVEGFGKGRLQ